MTQGDQSNSERADNHVRRIHVAAVLVNQQRDELIQWLAVKCRPTDRGLIEERVTRLVNDAVKLGAEVID